MDSSATTYLFFIGESLNVSEKDSCCRLRALTDGLKVMCSGSASSRGLFAKTSCSFSSQRLKARLFNLRSSSENFLHCLWALKPNTNLRINTKVIALFYAGTSQKDCCDFSAFFKYGSGFTSMKRIKQSPII